MKFFVDTANIDDIRKADSWGVVDGVTTNPTLIGREGKEFEPTVKAICELMGDRPVSAEVISTDAEGMLEEAHVLAGWAKNIVVKIPMCKEGMKAVKILSQEGIKTNVTLTFSAGQGLIAAKAGATYCSPFVGRIDDAGSDGMVLVKQLCDIYSAYGYPTQIIVASVRQPGHVIEAACWGAHVATVPFKVLDNMFSHPLTDIGMERFLADWNKLQEELGKG